MKPIIVSIALVCAASIDPAKAAVYTPTAKIGEILRQFEDAYKAGDQEWIQSAVDKAGVIEEARTLFFSFLVTK